MGALTFLGMSTQRHRYDVVVVGARAAGAATAMLLARQGHDVVVVDRDAFPSDTISTHQLARPGVVQLHRWGLLDDVLASGAPAIRAGHASPPRASRYARTVKDSAGRRPPGRAAPPRPGHAPRRGRGRRGEVPASGVTVDRRAPRRAPAGWSVCTATTAPAPWWTSRPVRRRRRRARLAGGPVGRRADRRGSAGAAAAVQYAYFAGVPWHGIELIGADRSFAGVFPTHDGEACVWVCGPDRGRRRAPPARLPGRGVHGQLEHGGARRWPSGCATAGGPRRSAACCGMPNHIRQAVRARLGAGRRRRLPPRPDHRARHERRLPRRRAARRRARPGAARRGRERTRWPATSSQRDRALREIFELTCALAAYPPVPAFVELQKQLGRGDRRRGQPARRPAAHPCRRAAVSSPTA